MRLRSAGLLLFMLGSLRADFQEQEVRALVGSNIELSCVHPKDSSFDLNDLYVYWQLFGSETVVAYYLPENSSTGHTDDHYRDRAQLSLDSMKQGNFSLRLYNVTPQDEQKFHCLVFRESLELQKVLDVVVRLHVAANYSMPVVSTPSSPSQDEELTFTCTSTNGYPRPNVYWINKTDNSLLDKALQNNTITLNPQGLYDVVSILKLRRSPNVNVGCCIENVLLHQNLTVSSQTGTFKGSIDSIPDIPVIPQDKNVTVTSIILALIVFAAMAVGWMCRSRCPHRSYAGATAATLEPELPDPLFSPKSETICLCL
ncbi:ICOS ligand isoform X2 [Tupaia chinensis]|uniref:ICOS ligand isoform X2 n=1 Tax=Tupaia chinensis TaxID=246437 RepID=UPI0003C91DED|nr:ICOS ligand isoform X2 [Tupaia chinensis]